MLKSELFPEESTITPANAPKLNRGSLKDRIMNRKKVEHVVKLTKPTKDLELKSSPESLAKTKKLLEQAGITKAKEAQTFSTPVEVFLVSGDRVTTSKMSLEAAPILKSCDVIVVPADGVTMLTYQIQKQYNEQVTLAMMLKDQNFKAAYQAAK